MTGYYDPQGFALEIFKSRYALHPEETFHEACERVAGHVAAAETNGNVVQYRQRFAELLKRNEFMPGGRIWYGSGRPKGQLLNCFVVPTSDSREGWGRTVSDEIVICGTGGGLGINFSPVRPRGSSITGHKGAATGAVSLMEIVDSAGDVLKAGGGRRTALMFCLSLTHGDLVEFMDKKLDLDQLKNANVSIWFDDDPEEFFVLVREGRDLELKHQGRVIGTVPARRVWEKILKNALTSGEPGMLNGHLFNRMSNIWYHASIISTNPCGEIGLCPYDCCCLGALVLPRFVSYRDDQPYIDYFRLGQAVILGHRFLDDVLTVNAYPLAEIKETCQTIRRVGLGVMGLADMLLLLGQKYSTAEGLETVDAVMKFIKNTAYANSIELAKEKGPFPAFDADRFLRGGFAKTLKPSLRAAIKEHGIRNCASMTIAPTGTTSIVSGVSSGIEPIFASAYIRRYRDGDDLKQEIVLHPLFQKFVEEKRSVKHFQGAYDLQLRDHFEMQRACQRHVDNAVSKTINVMPGVSPDELGELYMEYFPELKGVTVYPEGSRPDQPLTPLSTDEAMAAARGKGDKVLMSYSKDSCRDGSCDI